MGVGVGRIRSFVPSRAKIEGSEIEIDVRVDGDGSRVGYRITGRTDGQNGGQDFGPFRELIMRGEEVRCNSMPLFSPYRSFRLDEVKRQMIDHAVSTEEYLVAYNLLLTFIKARISNELASAQRLSKKYELEKHLSALDAISEGLENSVTTKNPSITARN